MTTTEPRPPRLHEDATLFREAVRFTSAQTGFHPRLIEKDYFCTLLLEHLAGSATELVFKGGTCLAKVHAGFYRLSEDLDFIVPMPEGAKRTDRSRSARPVKAALAALDRRIPGLRLVQPLAGANNSMQYEALVGYGSVLEPREQTIKLEVGLREPLLTPIVAGEVRTLLLDPLSGERMLPAQAFPCISMREAMAEKLRAALSRREPAIRDFYDIDHAVRHSDFQLRAEEFVALVRRKLAVPGNCAVDVSISRFETLRTQVEARLKPVLRASDFADFELQRAFRIGVEVASSL